MRAVACLSPFLLCIACGPDGGWSTKDEVQTRWTLETDQGHPVTVHHPGGLATVMSMDVVDHPDGPILSGTLTHTWNGPSCDVGMDVTLSDAAGNVLEVLSDVVVLGTPMRRGDETLQDCVVSFESFYAWPQTAVSDIASIAIELSSDPEDLEPTGANVQFVSSFTAYTWTHHEDGTADLQARVKNYGAETAVLGTVESWLFVYWEDPDTGETTLYSWTTQTDVAPGTRLSPGENIWPSFVGVDLPSADESKFAVGWHIGFEDE